MKSKTGNSVLVPNLTELMRQWSQDPVLFAKQVFDVDLWDGQKEICKAFTDKEHNYVAVRSGNKCGKTETCAILALWHVVFHPGSRVVLVAPTFRQIDKVIWKAVKQLYNTAKKRGCPLGGELSVTPDKGLRFEDGRDLFGIATDRPGCFDGISGKDLVLIVDEGATVPEPIWDAIKGNSAGGGKIITISNPITQSGTFYDAFHTKRDGWLTLHLSSLDAARTEIKGLADKKFLDWALTEFGGVDSPLYQMRVLGQFSTQGNGKSLISMEQIEQAIERRVSLVNPKHPQGVPDNLSSAGTPLFVGVDPARFGADSTAVIGIVGGRWVLDPVTVRKQDAVSVAGTVIDYVNKHRSKNTWEKTLVGVDETGLGGPICDYLRRHYNKENEQNGTPNRVRVVGINAGSKAMFDRKYPRKRDEVWFCLGEWFKKIAPMLPDNLPRLTAELLVAEFDHDLNGKRVINSKDEMKKKLGRSPDLADALGIAVYLGHQELLRTDYDWNNSTTQNKNQGGSMLHDGYGVDSNSPFSSGHDWLFPNKKQNRFSGDVGLWSGGLGKLGKL